MKAIERSEPEGTRVRHRLGIVGLPGFAPLPHLVLLHQKDLEITSEELNVFLHIFMHWHDAGRNPFPHTSTIAKRMDVSQRTVQRLVNQLYAKGLIEKIPGHKRKDPMRYDVRPLLKKLEGRAKSWAEERQIPIPQPPSINLIDML
jgi:DNA-binding MarR family transcriptional regulator